MKGYGNGTISSTVNSYNRNEKNRSIYWFPPFRLIDSFWLSHSRGTEIKQVLAKIPETETSMYSDRFETCGLRFVSNLFAIGVPLFGGLGNVNVDSHLDRCRSNAHDTLNRFVTLPYRHAYPKGSTVIPCLSIMLSRGVPADNCFISRDWECCFTKYIYEMTIPCRFRVPPFRFRRNDETSENDVGVQLDMRSYASEAEEVWTILASSSPIPYPEQLNPHSSTSFNTTSSVDDLIRLDGAHTSFPYPASRTVHETAGSRYLEHRLRIERLVMLLTMRKSPLREDGRGYETARDETLCDLKNAVKEEKFSKDEENTAKRFHLRLSHARMTRSAVPLAEYINFAFTDACKKHDFFREVLDRPTGDLDSNDILIHDDDDITPKFHDLFGLVRVKLRRKINNKVCSEEKDVVSCLKRRKRTKSKSTASFPKYDFDLYVLPYLTVIENVVTGNAVTIREEIAKKLLWKSFRPFYLEEFNDWRKDIMIDTVSFIFARTTLDDDESGEKKRRLYSFGELARSVCAVQKVELAEYC